MKILSNYSHTVAGVFYFDLPLGIVLTYLFHSIIRDPLIENLPLAVKQRAVPLRYFNWNFYFRHHWPVVIVSLIAGAFSHLLWDGFTHENGFFVEAAPWTQTQYTVLGTRIFLFRIFQHVSTVAGLCILAVVFTRLPVHRYVSPGIDTRYWILVAAITFIITAVRTAADPDDFVYTQIIVTAIAGGIVGLSLTPLLMKVFHQRTIA